MKVLFLDIDGVCNSASWIRELYAANGNKPIGMLGINPEQAAMVRQIVEKTGCQVVLSSTWRFSSDLRERVRNEVCEFIDATTRLHDVIRGVEIKHWLDLHQPVERYAVLDDDSDMLPDQPLFKTTWETGLTNEITQNVIKYLNYQTDYGK